MDTNATTGINADTSLGLALGLGTPDRPRRVFRATELEKLGVSQSTSYRRCRSGGPWQRLAPGIILTSSDPPTTDDLLHAALLHAGPQAVITGMHGARLHGMTTAPADAAVHVLIPHTKRLQSHPSIVIERTIRLPQAINKNGIPTAPLVRSAMDAARTWQTRVRTEEILIEAIQKGHCHPQALRYEMDHGSRRGTGLPREILRDLTTDLRSIPELRAFQLLQKSHIPDPLWNAHLFNADGKYIATPDAWFDDVGLAIEIDSYQFHFTSNGYTHTMCRNARYTHHGILILQILPGQLKKEPETVLASIKAAYAAAKVSPRPPVTVRPSPIRVDRAQ